MSGFTEKAIKDTFIQLLDEKPLSEITIKELTESCGINRNTFYYHYRDLTALVEEIMIETTDAILAAHPTLHSFEDCLYTILDFIKSNQQIVLHIYKSLSRTVFEKYLWRLCERLVDNYWNLSSEKDALPPEDQEIIKHFFICACFGMAMDWLSSGMPDSSARAKVHRLFKLSQHNHLLDNLP